MHIAVAMLLLFAQLPSQAGDVVIPNTNRPDNFSGAAGVYSIEVHAEPTSLRVEDPITLVVRIVAKDAGPWRNPPQRDKLQLFPAGMDADFFVEPLPERDQPPRGDRTWEFAWHLMPKHIGVKAIPAVEFVYYYTGDPPGFRAAEGGGSIALDVQPRPGLLLTAPPDAREKFEHIVEGQALLWSSESGPERLAVVAWSLSLPPALCVGGYILWRRLFPDAAERLRRRRGRGLRAALTQLRKLGTSGTPSQVRGIVADYLRLHIDLPPGGPTPCEVQHALVGRGLGKDIIYQTDNFVRCCDAALFAPNVPVTVDNLHGRAIQLVQHLETELCAASSR